MVGPEGTRPISLMWGTCYKLQGSDLPDALLESPQGKTVFFQTDFENSKVAVQKVSKWDEVVCKVRNHIEAVQIALKPNFRTGLETHILVTLTDKRHHDFSNSFLGIIQSNCANGSVYFNCHPNYFISLKDPHILKTLCLDIAGQSLDLESGASIIYKIIYRIMQTCLDSRALLSSPRGQTMLIEFNLNKESVTVPRMLSWEERLTRNPTWDLEDTFVPPKRSKDLAQIIKHPDGRVEIKFKEKEPEFPIIKEIMSSRDFMSSRLSTSRLRSGVSHPELKSTRLDHGIPNIQYEEGRPPSPTKTDMETESTFRSQLNVLTTKFNLDKVALQKEFMSKANEKDRKAFFKNFSEEEREKIRSKYFQTLEILQEHISFFRWFYQRKEYEYICTARGKTTWTTDRGEIKSEVPPLKASEQEMLFKIVDYIDDEEIKKSILKTLKESLEKPQEESSKAKIRRDAQPYSLKEILRPLEKPREVSIDDLQFEINCLKKEIAHIRKNHREDVSMIRNEIDELKVQRRINNEDTNPFEVEETSIAKEEELLNNQITKIHYKKWYSMVTIKIKNHSIKLRALIASGADQNYIQQGLIPTKYFEKTTKSLKSANGKKMNIQFKISNVHICNGGFCFINSFLLVKDLEQELILGTPFLTQLYPIQISEHGISSYVSGKEVIFKFMNPILPHNVGQIDINLIQRRQK